MRHRIAALVASCVLVVSAPALAQTTETTETVSTAPAETATTAVASAYQPAVEVPAAAAKEVAEPWTTRFLIPTLLALATIVLFATAVRYFTKVVRTRYRVVE